MLCNLWHCQKVASRELSELFRTEVENIAWRMVLCHSTIVLQERFVLVVLVFTCLFVFLFFCYGTLWKVFLVWRVAMSACLYEVSCLGIVRACPKLPFLALAHDELALCQLISWIAWWQLQVSNSILQVVRSPWLPWRLQVLEFCQMVTSNGSCLIVLSASVQRQEVNFHAPYCILSVPS